MSDNEWTHDWEADATFRYARIFDAQAHEITCVYKCNVVTGSLHRAGEHGERIIETRPAPLTVVFHE